MAPYPAEAASDPECARCGGRWGEAQRGWVVVAKEVLEDSARQWRWVVLGKKCRDFGERNAAEEGLYVQCDG